MQGCCQKVKVSVPPAAFLRVLSFLSERDKSYSSAASRLGAGWGETAPCSPKWGVWKTRLKSQPWPGAFLRGRPRQLPATPLTPACLGAARLNWFGCCSETLLARCMGGLDSTCRCPDPASGAGWVLHQSGLPVSCCPLAHSPAGTVRGREVSETCS